MRFPQKTEFEIPDEKLFEYLFSESHSVGKWKAAFFFSIGFGHHNAQLLKEALMKVAIENDYAKVVENLYGTKYVVDGDIVTPLGTTATIRTVWIRERGKEKVRLVTAYPGKSMKRKEKP